VPVPKATYERSDRSAETVYELKIAILAPWKEGLEAAKGKAVLCDLGDIL